MMAQSISRARILLKLALKSLLAVPGLVIATRAPSMRVLFYHRVNPYPWTGLGPVSREITVRPDAFAWQLDFLARKGFRVIDLADFEAAMASGLPLDRKTVLITFDDGYEDNLIFAAPLLASAGFPAVVFVVANFLGRSTNEVWPHADNDGYGRFLSEDQVRALDAHSIGIGSHTLTHPLLTRIATADLRQELVGSRRQLEAMLGKAVTSFAYPGGDVNAAVLEAVREAGYATAFTTVTGSLAQNRNMLALQRTEVSASDSRFVFRMKLAGALDWLAFKESARFRRIIGLSNRLLLPFVKVRT